MTVFSKLRYPLLWIININNPENTTAKPNPECRKIPKFASFRDWINSRHGQIYRYELAQHLHEYGIDAKIKDFIGLKVTNAFMLDAKFYRKSWNEVYVDAFMRVHMNVYTGNENSPFRRKITAYYRVRGYYDLENQRCHLFESFMPYRPEDDFSMRKLDDYLIPKIKYDELEDEAHRILKMHHPLALGGTEQVDPRIIAESMGLKIWVARITNSTAIKAQLYLNDKQGKIYRKDGREYLKTVPKFSILINRYFFERWQTQANSSAIHECVHFEEHSLFMLFLEIYAEELKLFYHPLDLSKLEMDAEDRAVLNRMEWQAKRLTPRVQMNEESVMELVQKLLHKCRYMDKLRQYNCITKELAKHFCVSKESAKYRFRELGLTQVSGVMEYISGDYIPDYEVENGLAPNQSYSIEFDEFSVLYANTPSLRELIKKGNFIYVEGHLCLNRPEYIYIENGVPKLKYSARHAMSSCCILFSKHYKNVLYSYKDSILQDSKAIKEIAELGAKFTFIGNIDDDFDRAQATTAIKKRFPNDFSDQLVFHMARLRIREEKLEELSEVSVSSITRYRNDEEQNISEPKLLSITVGMSLEPEFNYDFLVKGGYRFEKNTPLINLIKSMLQTRYLESIYSWREYLTSKGFTNAI